MLRSLIPTTLWVAALLLSACHHNDSDDDTALTVVEPNFIQYVNPIIGTNSQIFNGGSTNISYGNKLPYVAVPFPMILLSPQMTAEYATLYYVYCNRDLNQVEGGVCPDNEVQPLTGFRFSHMPTPYGGLGDYGYFSLMPLPASFDEVPTNTNVSNGNYGAFSHDNEQAAPDHYQVTFNNGIETLVTSSRRSGHLSFTFPEGQGKIVLNLSGGANFLDENSGLIPNQVTWKKIKPMNFLALRAMAVIYKALM